MVKAVFDEIKKEEPKNHFTVGINDDVTNMSLDYDRNFHIVEEGQVSALFYGLGADGTVGANKNSIKIMSIHASKGLEFEAVFLPMLWKNDYASRSASGKFK